MSVEERWPRPELVDADDPFSFPLDHDSYANHEWAGPMKPPQWPIAAALDRYDSLPPLCIPADRDRRVGLCAGTLRLPLGAHSGRTGLRVPVSTAHELVRRAVWVWWCACRGTTPVIPFTPRTRTPGQPARSH